ncbi:MAG: sugar transferase [Candidatus Sericytochromatia bacterium]|nr:sugar transferase [Candidatus Sericytochromatia bacterium]
MSYPPIKRSLDILTALSALILIWPVLLCVAIAIRLDSPGPALFLQPRVGLGGRVFRVFKFRSMRSDTAGPVLTQVNDPRITKLGHLLRRTSIDELPQLLNILQGDMSLIGPRPEVPSIVETYPSDWRPVFDVRPGLTGWAQIHGRDDLDIPTKLGYDLAYVANLRFGLDWRIFWATFPLLLKGVGIK